MFYENINTMDDCDIVLNFYIATSTVCVNVLDFIWLGIWWVIVKLGVIYYYPFLIWKKVVFLTTIWSLSGYLCDIYSGFSKSI